MKAFIYICLASPLLFSTAFAQMTNYSTGYNPTPGPYSYDRPIAQSGESYSSYMRRNDMWQQAKDDALSFEQGKIIAEGLINGYEIGKKRNKATSTSQVQRDEDTSVDSAIQDSRKSAPKSISDIVTDAYNASDNAIVFYVALLNEKLVLAQEKKRVFNRPELLVVDSKGEAYSLMEHIEDVSYKQFLVKYFEHAHLIGHLLTEKEIQSIITEKSFDSILLSQWKNIPRDY